MLIAGMFMMGTLVFLCLHFLLVFSTENFSLREDSHKKVTKKRLFVNRILFEYTEI